MGKSIDLTGKRFGKLTVLSLDPERYVSPTGKKTKRWKCICDCGKEVIVLQNALTRKDGTRSCGCSRHEKYVIDITNQRFGRLTVISSAKLEKPDSNGCITGWKCKCDCGKEIIVSKKTLLSGLRSCGCLLSESAYKKVNIDNVTKRYDHTVITLINPERSPNRNNTSGVKGVSWSKSRKKWIAQMQLRGQGIYLGAYKNIEDAKKAREEAEKKYFVPIIEAYNKENESNENESNENEQNNPNKEPSSQ